MNLLDSHTCTFTNTHYTPFVWERLPGIHVCVSTKPLFNTDLSLYYCHKCTLNPPHTKLFLIMQVIPFCSHCTCMDIFTPTTYTPFTNFGLLPQKFVHSHFFTLFQLFYSSVQMYHCCTVCIPSCTYQLYYLQYKMCACCADCEVLVTMHMQYYVYTFNT